PPSPDHFSRLAWLSGLCTVQPERDSICRLAGSARTREIFSCEDRWRLQSLPIPRAAPQLAISMNRAEWAGPQLRFATLAQAGWLSHSSLQLSAAAAQRA